MVSRASLLAWTLVAALGVLAAVAPAFAIQEGETAPNFSLNDADGIGYSLAALSSHPVLLMFLECGDAVSASVTPLVQASFYDAYAQQGLIVIGIECSGASAAAVAAFANQTGALFPLLMDGGSTRSAYDVETNSFVLVDGSGVVRYVREGPDAGAYDESAMKSAVEQVLREAASTKASTWGLIKNLYK